MRARAHTRNSSAWIAKNQYIQVLACANSYIGTAFPNKNNEVFPGFSLTVPNTTLQKSAVVAFVVDSGQSLGLPRVRAYLYILVHRYHQS